MSFVLDNSVALAWCFENEQTSVIMATLNRLTEAGPVAQQLWPIEAINGLLTAERRNRITGPERQRLAGFLHALPISTDGGTTSQVWTATAQLAAQHCLFSYNATSLEPAQRLGLPLATRDQALIAAADAIGVPLLPTA